MINVKEYLKEHMPEDSIGQYAIVSYDGDEDLIYFAHIQLESGEVFTESPCTLYKSLSEISIGEQKIYISTDEYA